MTQRAQAWFLYPARPDEVGKPAELRFEEFSLRAIAADEVLAEPLYGAWGANMYHALQRKPIDVCKQRGEPRVILGNAGVVRVLQVGADVVGVREGQLAMLFSASGIDRYGYPEKALAYDATGTMGCLSTRMILRRHELLPLPPGTRHALPRWAAFSGSHITAWSNWELAFGTLRLQLPADELPRPHVFGWGGGTTLAELELAQRHGCHSVAISASERRLSHIAQLGLAALDRRLFADLNFDEARFASEPEYRRAYIVAESIFLREVNRLTDGEKVHVFIDYIGTPVFRATLRALARQGVVTTAGWREGMNLSFLRAGECIARHQFIHTHYARYPQGVAATEYAEQHGWLPIMDQRIYRFDEIPELSRASTAGELGFYTAFSINRE
ncbi:MAG: zinc-binding dehydrogenase [Myxococcales bacterium]|nr:zinc-binding dehydrogenase [Myxococcales bacterium]